MMAALNEEDCAWKCVTGKEFETVVQKLCVDKEFETDVQKTSGADSTNF
jgi:hypothetical protein